jgi:hypothetical protein
MTNPVALPFVSFFHSQCQTCTKENPEEAKECSQCNQKKTDQKCICGNCRNSTAIPSTNFMDGLAATARDLSKSSRKIYYDIAGKPYLTCQKCNNHIKMPEGSVPAQPQAAAQPGAGAEGQPQPQPHPEQFASAAAIKNLTCPECKAPVESQ